MRMVHNEMFGTLDGLDMCRNKGFEANTRNNCTGAGSVLIFYSCDTP